MALDVTSPTSMIMPVFATHSKKKRLEDFTETDSDLSECDELELRSYHRPLWSQGLYSGRHQERHR